MREDDGQKCGQQEHKSHNCGRLSSRSVLVVNGEGSCSYTSEAVKHSKQSNAPLHYQSPPPPMRPSIYTHTPGRELREAGGKEEE